jgi:2-polyprenylphenol 6-hydroxylase
MTDAVATPPRDVVIIGAGLVGLALAVALARAGLSVTVADRAGVATGDIAMEDSDDWDSRVYAISPGSASFLYGIGAWQRLDCARISAIEAMQIRGDSDGELSFSAYDLGERALAWIVENRALHAALIEAVRVEPAIDVLAPCEPATLAWRSDAAELRLVDGRSVAARLIVGADGVRSWTRDQAAIRATPRPYEQTAVVANFATELAHRGRAFQWFLDGRGVLAWLPLPGRRVSMVWSAPVALATELAALDEDTLAWSVNAAGGNALGAMKQITASASYPLSFLKLASPVGDRLALVGDAAHGVHPLAGQGVNLGFGDAAALASALAVHGIVGDAGAPLLLERYANRRAEAVLAMQLATDGLARLFASSLPWVKATRNRGMSAVGSRSLIRRLLAQPALR